MEMPLHMILILYVITCIFPGDLKKLTMLHRHVHMIISMTFIGVNRIMSVCVGLSIGLLKNAMNYEQLNGIC